MSYLKILKHDVLSQVSYFERKNALLYQNMDDLGLILLAKRIKKRSREMKKTFMFLHSYHPLVENIKVYYYLFVKLILRCIKRQLRKLRPLLQILCSLPQ